MGLYRINLDTIISYLVVIYATSRTLRNSVGLLPGGRPLRHFVSEIGRKSLSTHQLTHH